MILRKSTKVQQQQPQEGLFAQHFETRRSRTRRIFVLEMARFHELSSVIVSRTKVPNVGFAEVTLQKTNTGWWFGTWFLYAFMTFHILGIMIPTDSHFSDGLKPPTRT